MAQNLFDRIKILNHKIEVKMRFKYNHNDYQNWRSEVIDNPKEYAYTNNIELDKFWIIVSDEKPKFIDRMFNKFKR